MIYKALLVNVRSLLSYSLFNLVELVANFCCLPTSAFQQYIISEDNCLCKCWHQSWCTPTFLGCVDFCRFYSCCYFHRCEMHNTKPRPQLLHHDAQGCTFCTELIGGLLVIPCTAVLWTWTPFPHFALWTTLSVRTNGYIILEGGNIILEHLGRQRLPPWSPPNLHFQKFSLATFLKEPFRASCSNRFWTFKKYGSFKRKF